MTPTAKTTISPTMSPRGEPLDGDVGLPSMAAAAGVASEALLVLGLGLSASDSLPSSFFLPFAVALLGGIVVARCRRGRP